MAGTAWIPDSELVGIRCYGVTQRTSPGILLVKESSGLVFCPSQGYNPLRRISPHLHASSSCLSHLAHLKGGN